VPDNWLWNYAHAVLDSRGIARSADRGYLLRAALLTAAAAFRWNGFLSMSLLRGTGSWFVHGSSFVTRGVERMLDFLVRHKFLEELVDVDADGPRRLLRLRVGRDRR